MRRHPDERDVRTRPNRRGSRPRTKRRPAHADAERGMITGVDRGRYTVLVAPDTPDARTVTAVKGRGLGLGRLVCGDLVAVVGDTSGRPGTLARVVRAADRTTTLRRTADDTDPVERVIVANADQLVIVTALADPEPRTRMIDRCVVAGYDARMDVLLCLTKADLADPAPIRDQYQPLDVDVVVTAAPDDADQIDGLAGLRRRLSGRVSVLIGHSGVGKSTLGNALVPDAERATGTVNAVTGRGRHTSSSAVALRLPQRDGWVIDTPGVRSFGLAHVGADAVVAAFDDLAQVVAERCPRGCTHLDDAPDCALDAWLDEDPALAAARTARVDSMRRLLTARVGD